MLAIATSLILFACGGGGEEVHIRDYRVFINTKDPAIESEIRDIIYGFNQGVGAKLFTPVKTQEEANSTINLVSIPKDASGNGPIGLGWALADVVEIGSAGDRIMGNSKTEVYYGMKIDLDTDYVYRKMGLALTGRNAARDATGSKAAIVRSKDAKRDLKTLVTHEKGHGIGFKHDETNQEAVMFPEVGGPKDFDGFFAGTRSFLGLNSNYL
jgi:hypothetical protein